MEPLMKTAFSALVAVAVLSLVSCVGVNPIVRADSTDMQCRTANYVFSAYEQCVRSAVASDRVLNTGPDVDLVSRYIAALRLLLGFVENGQVDDNLAFWASAEYYSALMQEYLGRVAASQALSQQQAESLRALGLGLIELGQPYTLGPAPGPRLTCIRQGAFVNCY